MVQKLSIILFAMLMCFKTEAAQSWKYTAFPYVPKNLPAKATEPGALRAGKTVLHPIMSKDSSTHAYWGVEQVYLSRDLKKKVYVKYNVKLNSVNPIGSWIALKGGHVLHLNNGASTVAYYAEGMNNVDLLDIQKQFLKTRKAASWNALNPFMSCANAEVTVGGDYGGEFVGVPEPAPASNEPSLLKRAGNVIACTGKETFDSAWASAKGLYENASWENIKNGTKATALAAWDAIPSWEETKAGFRATGDFISSTWNDPGKAWEGVKDKFEKTKQVVAQVYQKVAGAVENFKNLDPDVQDRIVCDAVSHLAADGVIGVLLSATGAGAAAAAAKLAHAVYKYATRIKPLMGAIEVLASTKDMAKDKLMEAVDKILKGKMDPKELEALKAKAVAQKGADDATLRTAASTDLRSENERLRNLTPEQRAAMLRTSAALTDDQRKVAASSALGRPLNKTQEDALLRAHNVGANRNAGYGTYTQAELAEKARILKEAGFSNDEIQNLMRRGIAGQNGYVSADVRFEAPQWGNNQGPRVSADYFKTNPELRLMKLEKPEDFAAAKQYFTEQGDDWARRGRPEVARVEYLRAGNANSYAETFTRPLPGGGYRLQDVDAARAAIDKLQKEINALEYPSGRVNVPIRNNADFFNTSEALYSREYYDRYVKVRKEAISNLEDLIGKR